MTFTAMVIPPLELSTRFRAWPVCAAIAVATMAFCAALAGAQPAPVMAALPDQPVESSGLPAGEFDAFRAPFVATAQPVALTVPSPNLSFTSGTDRNHVNLHTDHSGFEPMAFRPLFRAKGDHPDHVILDAEHGMAVASGFYDGARVRVYTAEHGKLVKIRDGVVPPGGHQASGWYPGRGLLSAKAGESSVRIKIDERFLTGRTYWFTVVAVDEYGRESEPGEAAKLALETRSDPKAREDGPAGRLNFKPLGEAEGDPPTPPKAVRAEIRDGVIEIGWEEAASTGLAGYRVKITPYDPASHKGFYLALPNREPRPDIPVRRNDVVFVDQYRSTLTPDNVASYAMWPQFRLSDPFKSSHIEAQTGFWWGDGSDFPVKWEFVQHPEPVPEEFVRRGRTCLRWENVTGDHTGFRIFAHAGSKQGWYPVLEAKEYKVEAWVRGSGTAQIVFMGPYGMPDVDLPFGQSTRADPKAIGGLAPIDLPLTDTWTKVTASFTPAAVVENGIGQIYIATKGPTVLYIDDLRIFTADAPAAEYHPLTLQRLNESGMRFMRTHELIKTQWGYSLDAITNPVGGNNYSGNRARTFTFQGLLDMIRKAGNLSPWLQVEMCLNEEEWLGFAEWLCAPYDPDVDTPEAKPWAAKRHLLGQTRPWIEEFEEFGFEISNETWNRSFAPYDMGWGMTIRDAATGEQHSWGALYGMLNEHIIGTMRSSPYWTDAVESKMKYFLCGWQAAQSFGAEARRYSPSSDAITYAAYQHNDWGLGDPTVVNDFKRFYWLQWGQSAVAGQTAASVATERMLAGEGIEVESGIYEFGPAYHVMPGDPKEAREVDAHLGRGMVAAVFSLDAALQRASQGFVDQAFFTFGHQTGSWGSHTAIPFGGYAYPYWKAFELYNHHGTGRFLRIQTGSSPTWDFPAYQTEDNMHKVRRDALPDAPLVSAYATVLDDRLSVFLLSRKLDGFPIVGDDGFTPVSLQLPASSARKITLYKLSGDPRVEDRFVENTRVETVEIPAGEFRGEWVVNESTGGGKGGLPPASIFLYVFEGAALNPINTVPMASFTTPHAALAGKPAEFTSRSSDPDGDILQHTWDFGAIGGSTEQNPAITFPEAGVYPVKLSVQDPGGESDATEGTAEVGLEIAGTVLRPVALPSSNAPTHVRASVEDGNTLVLTCDGDLKAGFFAAMTDPIGRRDSATLAADIALEAPQGSRGPAGGLMLLRPNREGLGFGHGDLLRQNVLASVLVTPDGTVLRRDDRKLVKIGSTQLPARLQLTLADGVAVATVNGQEVARFDVPQGEALSAGIAAGSGQGHPNAQRVVLRASGLEIKN